jgi:hypothetical protein
MNTFKFHAGNVRVESRLNEGTIFFRKYAARQGLLAGVLRETVHGDPDMVPYIATRTKP